MVGEAGAKASPWWLAAAGVFVALALPFFFVDVPPVLDYPNHLARLYTLAFGPGDPVLSAMYAPNWDIVPNLGLDLVGVPLVRLLPLAVAGRILLAAAAFLPVIGVVCYHRAVFGVRSYWPLAAAIVAFNAIFFVGFIGFLYGVGLAFAAAAFWIRFAGRRPAAAVLGAMLAVVVLFFCHLLAVLLFALLVGAHELAAAWAQRGEGRRLYRQLAVRGAMLVLALLPAAILYRLSALAGAPDTIAWAAPDAKVICLLTPVMTYNEILTFVTFFACVAFVVACLVPRRRLSFDGGSMIAIVIIAALYVVAPDRMMSGAVIDVRLPLLAALAFIGGVRPTVDRPLALTLGAATALLIAVRSVVVADVWYDHRSDLAELRAAIAPIEAGARVLVVTTARTAPQTYIAGEPAGRLIPGFLRVDEHMAALLLIERHAFWPLLFADPRQQPIVVRPPYAAIARPLGEPPDVTLIAADRVPGVERAPYLADWADTFDYVLVLDAGAIDDAALRPDRLQLLHATDMAALYRIRRP